ncbi:MAG: hypothetical protein ACOYB0_01505 [Polynucleobacter sp.]
MTLISNHQYTTIGKILSYHGVLWISGIHDDQSGLNSTARNAGDVEAACKSNGSIFQHVRVKRAIDLDQYIKKLTHEVLYSRHFPIIHLDFHGDKELGLKIAPNDYLSWEKLFSSLRVLNEVMSNSLVVIGAACEAYWALKVLISNFDKATPMYLYIAPEETVSIDFLDQNLQKFYLSLLETGDAMCSAEILHPQFKLWHCERFLFITICKYIGDHCKGKTARIRAESLLSQLLEKDGNLTNISIYRKNIKKHLKPSKVLLDKYANTFLCGDSVSFSIEDIYEFIDQKSSAKNLLKE